MRIFLFILILLPFSSFNQEKLDLRDLKSISSKSTFQKVVLENGFSKNSAVEWKLNYGYKLDKNFSDPDKYQAVTWASFYYSNETFMFQFYNQEPYNRIVRQIQSSCNFHSIDERTDYDIIFYGCPGARFKGVIGYCDNGDGSLFILTKLPTRN